MTCFVETNEFIFRMCFNIYGWNMTDHIENIFNSMIDDLKYIKLATYFKSARR